MDEDKDSKQNLGLWSNKIRRKSLTDQRNDFLAGGMPPLTNSDVFNLPVKFMASGFNSLHAGIFSMLFVIC